MPKLLQHRLICGDCLEWLPQLKADCVFADPPDNIGLKYGKYKDRIRGYDSWLCKVLDACLACAPIVWLSFNARYLPLVGHMVYETDLIAMPCVQTFTFGQHNHKDLCNCHRPLWRFMKPGAPLYPEQVRVPSWRQLNGDKRADERGRIPGDHFDFPRVTGNSKQRRAWHPTQLHEGLVERCLLLTTKKGDVVVDPFLGTGTTMRVCKRLGRYCTGIEIDPTYCEHIRSEGLL